jgi:nitrate reductase gamma subunit
MEAILEFARGPLFAFTFLVMILGLTRLAVVQFYFLTVKKGRRLGDVKWSDVAKDTLSWVVPVRHITPGSEVFSAASFLMHIGLIIVPLLLMDHIALWEAFLGVRLPAIGKDLADSLTLFTIACILVLLACRMFVPQQRMVSRRIDYLALLVILLTFASGYAASHPAANPFRWDVTMLIHILSAEALFVMVPFSKLSHVVLFFFDRISAVHWQLRPGAGDQVAEALLREEVKTS